MVASPAPGALSGGKWSRQSGEGDRASPKSEPRLCRQEPTCCCVSQRLHNAGGTPTLFKNKKQKCQLLQEPGREERAQRCYLRFLGELFQQAVTSQVPANSHLVTRWVQLLPLSTGEETEAQKDEAARQRLCRWTVMAPGFNPQSVIPELLPFKLSDEPPQRA